MDALLSREPIEENRLVKMKFGEVSCMLRRPPGDIIDTTIESLSKIKIEKSARQTDRRSLTALALAGSGLPPAQQRVVVPDPRSGSTRRSVPNFRTFWKTSHDIELSNTERRQNMRGAK